jgi:hypothetical protein
VDHMPSSLARAEVLSRLPGWAGFWGSISLDFQMTGGASPILPELPDLGLSGIVTPPLD